MPLLANVHLFLNNKPLIRLDVALVQLGRRRKNKQSLIPKGPVFTKARPLRRPMPDSRAQRGICGAFVSEQLEVWLSRTRCELMPGPPSFLPSELTGHPQCAAGSALKHLVRSCHKVKPPAEDCIPLKPAAALRQKLV